MAKRPTLPLETQAAIEDARDKVLLSRPTYRLLFDNGVASLAAVMSGYSVPPRPATLKLEIQRYSAALFDAEAQFYIKHAGSKAELAGWLSNLTLLLQQEITQEIFKKSPLHDRHCSIPERTSAISESLKERYDHWLNSVTALSFAIQAQRAETKQISSVLQKNFQPLIEQQPKDSSQNVSTPSEKITKGDARKAFVIPILEQKGWSILDWANESKVAYHTAADYLEGTTDPFRSSRLKLAKGLGVDVDRLPR